MNDPVITRFAEACGAAAPLDLRVDLADSATLAEGSVPMPFALVGRDDACDVTLTDAEVNPRHAWLQVVGGRVFAIDLGSRTGLGWPRERTGSGWLDVGTPARVGPFKLWLRSPVTAHPSYFPPGYDPLKSDPSAARSRPGAILEFRNGKRAIDRWTVDRHVTLVGRTPECKIRLTADDIAGYHCGLVLTRDGLWVVDLSGRGVVVNGERMRVSPLRPGAELWIGRFLIGLPAARSLPPAPATAVAHHPPDPTCDTEGMPSAEVPEDEVQIGIASAADAASGLPSSHIMADAFRLWEPGAAGAPGASVSNPIMVSASGPAPPTLAATSFRPYPVPPVPGPFFELLVTPPPPARPPVPHADAAVVPLLRQLGELQGQMLAQYQQSLDLVVRLLGSLRPEQMPTLQLELERLQDLNGELAQIQAEVARRAPAQRVAPSTQTPSPDPPSSPAPDRDDDSTALHEWVGGRIDTLQREHQARWQSLVSLFSGKTA